MKIIMFYHSLYSDWNHGNAHFLRGIVKELIKRNHQVSVYEPFEGWSLANLIKDHGKSKLNEFSRYYPMLKPQFYNPEDLESLDEILSGADLVIVHEWNEHNLVAAVGEKKAKHNYKLLFHDTHHRAASEPESMAKYDFSNYDGALVFGDVIRKIYQQKGWVNNVWTWHEAADAEFFKPFPEVEKEGDLVWIGNWGDNERTEELMEFLIKPVKELKLKAKVYGVRYPAPAIEALKDAGIEYGGWLPNYKVPQVFAKYKVTVHVPRKPYVKLLPGIPTIRPFEAMSCGIPLVSSPWNDSENLFEPGKDFLFAANGEEMKHQLSKILADPDLAKELVQNGRKTILDMHTCANRVDELENIMEELGIDNSRIMPQNILGTGVTSSTKIIQDKKLSIAFFGSSIVSAYWNGAATYYRGIVRALDELGYAVTFYEPDAYNRQEHRDIPDPDWCKVVIYENKEEELIKCIQQAANADIIIKASGVGVFDELLEEEIPNLKRKDNLILFWDVDAPATLDRMQKNEDDQFWQLVPKYDLVLTYGGGKPVVNAYEKAGAKKCIPIYNALDTSTHFPVEKDQKFKADLAFLGNRLPDREKRVEEFFIKAANGLPDKKFIIGGSGWGDKSMPENINYVGHVYTKDHNSFNCTPTTVLNISRDSMASYGFSPATRVFEAAGAGACIITDYWEGISHFFEPEEEILVAKNGDEVQKILSDLTPEKAKMIGKAAYKKVIEKHTYAQRAILLNEIFNEYLESIPQLMDEV